MIGAAIDIEGETTAGTSKTYIENIRMKNCASEDAGYIKMVRGGGLRC